MRQERSKRRQSKTILILKHNFTKILVKDHGLYEIPFDHKQIKKYIFSDCLIHGHNFLD